MRVFYAALVACLLPVSAAGPVQALISQVHNEIAGMRLAVRNRPNASSPRGGRRLTGSGAERILVCSWDDVAGECVASASYTAELMEAFADGSPLIATYETQRACQELQDEAACSADPACRWAPNQLPGEGCGAALTRLEVEALSLGELDTTSCGWVAAALSGISCGLYPATADACPEGCELRVQVVAVDGECVEEMACVQSDEALVAAFCGPDFDTSIMDIPCSLDGVETIDQVLNRYVYCYRNLCPQMGEMRGYMEGAAFHCDNIEDREECASDSICYYSNDSSCRSEELEVYRQTVPIGCAYRNVLATIQECYALSEEECGIGCVWLEEEECISQYDQEANADNDTNVTCNMSANSTGTLNGSDSRTDCLLARNGTIAKRNTTTGNESANATENRTEAVGNGTYGTQRNFSAVSRSANATENHTEPTGNGTNGSLHNAERNSTSLPSNTTEAPDFEPYLLLRRGRCVPTAATTLQSIASSACVEGKEARTIAKLKHAYDNCPRETRQSWCRLEGEAPAAVCETATYNHGVSSRKLSWLLKASISLLLLLR
mmetsp:Transcript_46770/g.109102  ORF Transcript_46770/g.109102 Transcript_46770/m.109102 type:complete len:553 (-) Transcript_46770:40-1698(-)